MKMHTTPLPLFPSQILSGENQSNFVLGIARSHVDLPLCWLLMGWVGSTKSNTTKEPNLQLHFSSEIAERANKGEHT